MNISNAEFIKEIIETTSNMYRLGWNERNGGNISVLVTDDEIAPYRNQLKEKRKLPFPVAFKELSNKYFVVTGTGKYFKNVCTAPETSLGLIRIAEDGTYASLLWGFNDGGSFTSEIVLHLDAHIQRIKAGDNQHVVIHAHPANIVAMTHIHSWDEKEFSLTLWNMITECVVIFPEGVAVLPWMVSSSTGIGEASAKKFEDFRILIWALHGIIATGTSLDEAFGLIETVEKAAEIYMKIATNTEVQNIDKSMLREVARDFNLKVKDGWLDGDIKLTSGVLKKVYDKTIEFFETGIDCNIHKEAYKGTHPDIAHGFAGSEFAGKYLDTCVNLYKNSGNKNILNKATELVRCIVENQHEDGYIGGYAPENEWTEFSVWNQAFTVYGLVSYHKVTKDKAALTAAEKCVQNIADYYMNKGGDILDATNWGTQNLSILIALPQLYSVTQNKFYLDFMEYIFTQIKGSTNNFFEFDSIFDLESKKGIENFIILIAMVLSFEITNKTECLKGAQKYWEELQSTQIRRTGNGSNTEVWIKNGNKPAFLNADVKPNETCVSVGWAELSMCSLCKRKKQNTLMRQKEHYLITCWAL